MVDELEVAVNRFIEHHRALVAQVDEVLASQGEAGTPTGGVYRTVSGGSLDELQRVRDARWALADAREASHA